MFRLYVSKKLRNFRTANISTILNYTYLLCMPRTITSYALPVKRSNKSYEKVLSSRLSNFVRSNIYGALLYM